MIKRGCFSSRVSMCLVILILLGCSESPDKQPVNSVYRDLDQKRTFANSAGCQVMSLDTGEGSVEVSCEGDDTEDMAIQVRALREWASSLEHAATHPDISADFTKIYGTLAQALRLKSEQIQQFSDNQIATARARRELLLATYGDFAQGVDRFHKDLLDMGCDFLESTTETTNGCGFDYFAEKRSLYMDMLSFRDNKDDSARTILFGTSEETRFRAKRGELIVLIDGLEEHLDTIRRNYGSQLVIDFNMMRSIYGLDVPIVGPVPNVEEIGFAPPQRSRNEKSFNEFMALLVSYASRAEWFLENFTPYEVDPRSHHIVYESIGRGYQIVLLVIGMELSFEQYLSFPVTLIPDPPPFNEEDLQILGIGPQ